MSEFSKNVDDFYLNDYESIMNSGLVGRMWRYIHKSLDKPFAGLERISVIEVGSGNGQHFNLTSISTEIYVEVDSRISLNTKLDLKKAKNLGRKFFLDDATQLAKFSDFSFDGLIATCLLVHLSDMETALMNWRRVVKPGGILSIYLPNEPGILLRAARALTTKKRIEKLGYDHEFIHWTEHRNHFLGMRSMIKHVFHKDTIKFRRFPIHFLSWNLGLFTLVEIRINDLH